MRIPRFGPLPWLFLFLLSLYLLTISPIFHSSDGLAMFAVTENLVRRGGWDISQLEWMELQQGSYGSGDLLYCRKGPGLSLVALPLAWLGMLLPGFGIASATLLANSLITAATAVVLAASVRQLGYGERLAAVVGLIYGTATLALPYSKTFFSDPLAGLGLSLALLAGIQYRRSGGLAYVVLCAAGLGLALTTRMANLVVVPFYAAYVGWDHLRLRWDGKPRLVLTENHMGDLIRAAVAFVVPLAIAVIGLLAYNQLRFGSPFVSGYLPEEQFSGNWIEGIAGLLISPGRGLLLYSPVLVFAFLGWRRLVRQHPQEGLLTIAVVATYILLYGKWFMWHGGFSWGPRFLVPVLPLLSLGLAPWLAQPRGRLVNGLLATAIVVGLAFSLLGSVVHFSLVQVAYQQDGLPLFHRSTFFDPRLSPLLQQWDYLRPDTLDLAWVYPAEDGQQLDWPLLAVAVVALARGGWGLWSASRERSRSWLAIIALGITVWLGVLVVTRCHNTLTAPWSEPLSMLQSKEQVGDVILFNRLADTVAISETYRGKAWVIGLHEGEDGLSERATWWLERSLQPGQRVWWIPNWLPPERSAVEQALMGWGYRVLNASEADDVRLALYAAPADELAKATVAERLGPSIRLVDASWTGRAASGQELLVRLTWQAEGQQPERDWMVYIHLLSPEGQQVVARDGMPLLWLRPTSTWLPGEVLEDRHGFLLPSSLPAGRYELRVGMYDQASGERLRTADGEDGITLAPVEVVNP